MRGGAAADRLLDGALALARAGHSRAVLWALRLCSLDRARGVTAISRRTAFRNACLPYAAGAPDAVLVRAQNTVESGLTMVV